MVQFPKKEAAPMAIQTVLFDLDGTLLPMDQNVFVKSYLGRIAKAIRTVMRAAANRNGQKVAVEID